MLQKGISPSFAIPPEIRLAVLNGDGSQGCAIESLFPDTSHRGRDGNAGEHRTAIETIYRNVHQLSAQINGREVGTTLKS